MSTGARASELLGVRAGDVDPGQQLISVIRKRTRAVHQLPASPDAFVWLRLYQEQLYGLVPTGRDEPLWRSLCRPFRALSYDAGDKVLRTHLIESALHYRRRPVAGKTTLQERRSHVSPTTVAHARVAHRRLSGRYRRLMSRGPPPNIINTAVARELAGFIVGRDDITCLIRR